MRPADQEESTRLERERLDAEREYNAALTALDGVVISSNEHADLPRLATALVVFLQKITALVETKDRQLAADVSRRLDSLAPAVESMAELRTQMSLVQRRLQSLERNATAPRAEVAAPSSAQPATALPQPILDDVVYLAFEDQFRGSVESVRERLSAYLPLFAGATDVVDVGCGRGEFLAALAQAGVPARGVDANAAMAAVARERGVDATHGDALAFLTSLPDASIGGLIATQVAEHLEPAYLSRLLLVAAQKLKPGAPIVVETINAACWLAFFSSYLRDPTHVRPLHPDTLQYLLRASGFERVEIHYSAPVPDQMKMKGVELSPDVLRSQDLAAEALTTIAHTLNANAAILNAVMFSHMDYAAIGYRPA